MDPRRPPQGLSPVIATMLLVGMTVVLSALAYLLISAAPMAGMDPSMFQYIHITAIRHDGDPFTPNCDAGCILLIHEGNAPLENDGISALVLGNDETLKANITTLNGHLFLPTKHYGVEHLGGSGSRGSTWDPGEEIYLDLKDDLIRAGDLVTVRIIDKTSHLVVSEDTLRA